MNATDRDATRIAAAPDQVRDTTGSPVTLADFKTAKWNTAELLGSSGFREHSVCTTRLELADGRCVLWTDIDDRSVSHRDWDDAAWVYRRVCELLMPTARTVQDGTNGLRTAS